MKIRSFIVLLLIIYFAQAVYCQNNTYSQLKESYKAMEFKFLDNKPYYSPLKAGLNNLIYSGMGHYYVDEPERGKIFIKAEMITESIALISFPVFFVTTMIGFNSYNHSPIFILLWASSGLAPLAAIVVVIGIRTWSIIDACKIAKVKSVAFDSKFGEKPSWDLFPEIKMQQTKIDQSSYIYGMTLRLSF